jgi:uncharacterized protein (TIGR00251 family)
MLRRIKVKPSSRNPRIEEAPDGSLTVHLKSPPVEGRANDELIARLAAHYGVSKSRVRIKSGAASRNKLVEIETGS